jgi:hypothetical protein
MIQQMGLVHSLLAFTQFYAQNKDIIKDNKTWIMAKGLGVFLFTTASRPALGPTSGYHGLLPWG